MPILTLEHQKQLGLLTESEVLTESLSAEPNGELPDAKSLPKIVFRTQKLEGVKCKKKIIISDFLLPYVRYDIGTLLQFVGELLASGFTLYAMQTKGLIKVKNVTDLADPSIDMPVVTDEAVKKAMNDENVAASDAVILDYFKLRKMAADYHHYCIDKLNFSIAHNYSFILRCHEFIHVDNTQLEKMVMTMRNTKIDMFEIDLSHPVREDILRRFIKEHPEARKLSLIISEPCSVLEDNLRKVNEIFSGIKVASLKIGKDVRIRIASSFYRFDFSELQNIALQDTELLDDQHVYSAGAKNINQLKIGKFFGCDVVIPNLKKLSISFRGSNIDDVVDMLLKHNHIEQLSLSIDCYWVKDTEGEKKINEILCKLKQVKFQINKLDIHVSPNNNPGLQLAAGIISLCASTLVELSLDSFQHRDTGKLIKLDPVKLPRLKIFKWVGPRNGNCELFSYCLSGCEHLDSLEIPCKAISIHEKNSYDLSFLELGRYPHLVNLKEFRFNGPTELIAEQLRSISPSVKLYNTTDSYGHRVHFVNYSSRIAVMHRFDLGSVDINHFFSADIPSFIRSLSVKSCATAVFSKRAKPEEIVNPNIEELTLEFFYKISINIDDFFGWLHSLSERFPNLKYLNINFGQYMPNPERVDELTSALLPKFKCLKRIRLYNYGRPFPLVKALYPHVDDNGVTDKYFNDEYLKRENKLKENNSDEKQKDEKYDSKETVSIPPNVSFLDGDTVHNSNKVVSVTKYFLPKTDVKHDADEGMQRVHFTSKIKITKDAIVILDDVAMVRPVKPIKTLSNADFSAKVQQYNSESVHQCVSTVMCLDHDNWQRLPSNSPDEKIEIVYEDIELGYSFEQRCYFVKLADHVKQAVKVVPIKYTVESQLRKYDWKINQTYYKKHGNSIFQHVDFVLQSDGQVKLVPHSGFEKRFNKISKLPLERRIAELVAYFKLEEFNSEATDPKLNGVALLNELMHKRKGSCRHRVILFQVIAELIGIKSMIVRSKPHAFVEINYLNSVFTVDLGGFETKRNIISAPTPVEVPKLVMKQLDAKPLIDIKSPPADVANYIKTMAEKLNQYKPHNRNQLIMVNSDDDLMRFHAGMLSKVKDRQYFYLDDLSNVTDKQLLVTKDKKYQIADSQLAAFLKNAKPGDVLMVNWSFCKPEHVGFNSMMDDERIIMGIKITPGVIVCGVIEKSCHDKFVEDFYSRFRRREVIPEITDLPELNIPTQKPLNKNIARIDLHGGEDWEKELLGIVNIKKNEFTAILGKLAKAIDQKCDGIELVNAPWNYRPFAIFMAEISSRGSFEFQNKLYTFPKGFKFFNGGEHYDFSGRYTIERHVDHSPRWEFNLDRNTYSRFLANYCSEDGLFTKKSGWIAKDKVISVLVTGELTDGQWSRLLSKAKKKNCNLRFIVPDHIKLPEKMRTNCADAKMQISQDHKVDKPVQPVGSVRYIQTNDIAYTVAASLQKEKLQHVVSISEDMKFNDVWEILNYKGLDDGGLQFTSRASEIWEWLDKGETVVLKGHFSKELISRTESLFSEKPYLWMNGKKHDLKGRLVIITDQQDGFVSAKPERVEASNENYWSELEKHYKKSDCDAVRKECKSSSLVSNYSQLNTVLHSLATSPARHPLRSFALLDNKPDETLEKLKFDSLSTRIHSVEYKTEDVVTRRLFKMDNMLRVSPYVFLMGPSGTGKSTVILSKLKDFYLKEMKQAADIYNGMEKLEEWASQTDKSKKHILFIDEANLEKNGTFEKFEGLFDEPPGILLHGKWYPIGPHQKVVFAGNYSHYTGRHQHDLFQNHGSVMLYNDFPPGYLMKSILLPVLKSVLPNAKGLALAVVSSFLVHLYRTYKELMPRNLLTIRNLHAICLRLGVLENEPGDVPSKVKFLAYKELKQLLNEEQLKVMVEKLQLPEQQCKEFNEKLEKQATAAYDSKEFVLTQSRYPLTGMFVDELATRALRAKTPGLSEFGTRGEIVEGASGVGKSFMAKDFLKFNGFIEVNLDTVDTPEITKAKQENKVFYHCPIAQPEKALKILHKAFHEGAIVIIDEINTLNLERILNTYLMGKDLAGKSAQREGFYVIGTQNPVSFAGRKGFSRAFDNRFHKVVVPEYSANELQEILVKRGCKKEEAVRKVDDFMRQKQESLFPPLLRDLWVSCQG